ncbi:MAG: hypothetical protein ACRDTA_11005, partial [Pseudonocardiaceae bacterium]
PNGGPYLPVAAHRIRRYHVIPQLSCVSVNRAITWRSGKLPMVSPRRRPVELFTVILAVVLGVSLLAGLGRDTTDSAGAGFEGSGRVVIQNVSLVLTMDPKLGEGPLGRLEDADGLIDGVRISAVGKDLPDDGAQVLDGHGKIVLPGFVDLHNHLWQALIRGCATDQDLQGRILPQEPAAQSSSSPASRQRKSTIAQMLAERLPRSVHVRGDLFRRMLVNGRADMLPEPSDEAARQLRLRHQLTAMVREAARGKVAYDTWTVDRLDDVLRHQTPRLGLWLDTSGQTPTETVNEILTRAWTEAGISP